MDRRGLGAGGQHAGNPRICHRGLYPGGEFRTVGVNSGRLGGARPHVADLTAHAAPALEGDPTGEGEGEASPADDVGDYGEEGGEGGDYDVLEIELLLEEHGAVGAGGAGDTVCGGSDAILGGEGEPPAGSSGASGSDAPPPPAPHLEAPAKGKGKGGGGQPCKRYPIWDGEGAEIAYILCNESAQSFDPHCLKHGNDCSITRTWMPYRGDGDLTQMRAAQSGILSCLGPRRSPLSCHGRGPRRAHGGKGGGVDTRCVTSVASDLRKACRHYAEMAPNLSDLRAKEHQPREGEPLEPLGRF